MTIRSRAAFAAIVTVSAISIATLTAPGFALETSPSSPSANAQAQTPVPTLAEALTELQQTPALPPVPAAPPATVQPLPSGYVQAAPPAPAGSDVEGDAAGERPARRSYATLAAAVDDHDGRAGAIDAETNCLAIGVYYESKGEPLAGQLAVANVILNRTRSGRFPRSVCGVLTQRGQFSFVRGGRLPQPGANGQWRTSVAISRIAQGDMWQSSAPRAMFFHARYVSPGWRRERVASIGNHIFYR